MKIPTLEIGTAESMVDCSPVQKLIAMVLLLAIKDRASEIRIQAQKNLCRLFYVIRGVSIDLVPPPPEIAPQVIRSIQAAAHLDLPSFRNETQNRMQLRIGDFSVPLVVEILTIKEGKEAVIRFPDLDDFSEKARIVLNSW
jgi:type IV pilus assembly protein PilB